MPVKFWHTSLRFWFFLSYLFTTVQIVFNKFSATTNLRWIHCVALEATAICTAAAVQQCLRLSLAFEAISSYRSFSGWFVVISQPKNGLFDRNSTWSQGFKEEVTSRKTTIQFVWRWLTIKISKKCFPDPKVCWIIFR